MWCIEAFAKKTIPLISKDSVYYWDNKKFIEFLEKKSVQYQCPEFEKAIKWIGNRDFFSSLKDCTNIQWSEWAKNNLLQSNYTPIVLKGDVITITKGVNQKYAIWSPAGIFDLTEEYVGETIKIVSNN